MSGLVGANKMLDVMVSITSAMLCLPDRRRQSSSLPIGVVAEEMNDGSQLQFCNVLSLSDTRLPRSSGVTLLYIEADTAAMTEIRPI